MTILIVIVAAVAVAAITVLVLLVGQSIDARLVEIKEGINGLKAQGAKIMRVSEEIKAALVPIDTATNTVAAEVTALREQLKANMTPAEVEEIKAQAAGIAARLTTIGKPETPAGDIPPTEPTLPIEA